MGPLPRGARLGKRLAAWLLWRRSTDGAEHVGREELDRLDREARDDGLDAPDRAAMIALWTRQGWPGDLEPLHRMLLRYEGLADLFGEPFVAAADGPRLRWPRGWGSWALADHREILRRHRLALGDVQDVERWYRSLAGGGAAR